jgi:hypothetical protein
MIMSVPRTRSGERVSREIAMKVVLIRRGIIRLNENRREVVNPLVRKAARKIQKAGWAAFRRAGFWSPEFISCAI